MVRGFLLSTKRQRTSSSLDSARDDREWKWYSSLDSSSWAVGRRSDATGSQSTSSSFDWPRCADVCSRVWSPSKQSPVPHPWKDRECSTLSRSGIATASIPTVEQPETKIARKWRRMVILTYEFRLDEWFQCRHCSAEHPENRLKPIEKIIHRSKCFTGEKFLGGVIQEVPIGIDDGRVVLFEVNGRSQAVPRFGKEWLVVRMQFQEKKNAHHQTCTVHVRLEHEFIGFHVEEIGKDFGEQTTGRRASTKEKHAEEKEQRSTGFMDAIRRVRLAENSIDQQIHRHGLRTDEQGTRLIRVEKFVRLKTLEQLLDQRTRRRTGMRGNLAN